MFRYLFDVSILQRLHSNEENNISTSFSATYDVNPLRYSEKNLLAEDVTFGNIGHLVNYSETNRVNKCKLRIKTSKFVGGKCNIGLHPEHWLSNYYRKLLWMAGL